MPAINEKRAVIAKIEAAYGTDAAPTGAANAVVVKNLNWRPLEVAYASREGLALPYLGRRSSKTARKSIAIDFDVEAVGSGAAGTAPAYGALLRACGLSETINAAVSVVYAPVSSAFESASIYANIDGMQQKAIGWRGSVAFVWRNEEIPVFRFRGVALYAAPSDQALPVLTLTGWQDPLPGNKTNTTPITLHGYACGLQEADLDLGNEIQHQSFPGGSEQVFLTSRRPSGRVVIERPTIAQKDYFALVDSGAVGSFSITHGVAAGNKVAVAAAQSRLTNPQFGDVRGIATLGLDLELAMSNAGNDEISITVQ